MKRKRSPNGKGLTRKDSTVVHVRVSKQQQERLAKIANQANMPLGQLLREMLETTILGGSDHAVD